MDTSDLENLGDNQALRKIFIERLAGYKCRTILQKKLVLGVLHRRGHKDFEEDSDNQNDQDRESSG